MGKTFRFAMRGTLILLLLTGVALVIYSLYHDNRTEPGAITSRADHEGGNCPAAQRATSATTLAIGERIGSKREGEMRGVVFDFSQVIRDPGDKDSVGVISGPQATWKPSENVFQIVKPLLVAQINRETGERDEARFTAEEATLNEEKGIVELQGNVAVDGMDLRMTTDRATYRAADRTLRSDAHVVMRRERTDEAGEKQAVMSVKGNGLNADMREQKFSVNSNVTTCLFNVSEDFLASGSAEEGSASGATDIVILSDGPVTYDHLIREVIFSENVHASFGDKRLKCDEMTIQFAEKKDENRREVTDILASGHVELDSPGQSVRGETLKWRNVTQMGLLTGAEASIETEDFSISGQKLNFFRLSSRFSSQGPGELFWKGSRPQQPSSDTVENKTNPWRGGPFQFNRDASLRVTWQDSMTYDTTDGLATFDKDVTIVQGKNSLSSDQLKASFDGEGQQSVSQIVAEGQVSMRNELTNTAGEALCQRMVWDAAADTVELSAAEGKTVTISTGDQTICAPQIVFDNINQTLKCRTPGRLITSPKPTDHRPDA
ncbi:MAG: LPS export ABC transporter periplasmic protein LptC, partial [Planctomycetes bacterium]|nr:LPS export ABC transporter periplasmic protein LptC [Planctomycetota bacterium]